MNALTVPARPDHDTSLRPVPWRRMAWVTWRQHRFVLGGVATLLGAMAVYLWLAGHRMLTGPAAEADRYAQRLVVQARRAEAQAHLLVRATADDPVPPGWEAHPVGLEELALGYLREPGAASGPGPANGRPLLVETGEPSEVTR